MLDAGPFNLEKAILVAVAGSAFPMAAPVALSSRSRMFIDWGTLGRFTTQPISPAEQMGSCTLLCGDRQGISAPLQRAINLELWHRRETELRRSVAVLMRDISGYATIPSAHVVRQLEARELAMSWKGRIRDHIKPRILGHGAAHGLRQDPAGVPYDAQGRSSRSVCARPTSP